MIITEFCTGCRACEQLCPKQCISMKSNQEGFLVAEIDESVCINCGLCQKRCPQNNMPEKYSPIKVLAVRYKKDMELKESASGGAFVALAHQVLGQQDGVVFGAAYGEDWKVGHISVRKEEDLYKLQGSKYVQCDTQHTYSEVKALLNEGKKVLFSGTPCQIGGLRGFLRKDYDNLFTVDLICHGVPSPKLFQKYIEWLGTETKGKILYYNFRDKTGGWGLGYKAKTNTKTKTKTKTKTANLDPYYYHFLKGDTYRECCYRCRYCTQERISDITIGDYWGIEQEHPKFYSTKGVSVMMLNTDKALGCFEQVKPLFYTQDSTFEQASRKNHNLLSPTKRTLLRDTVYNHLDDKNAEEYFNTVLKAPNRLTDRIKDLLPMRLKLILKTIKQKL